LLLQKFIFTRNWAKKLREYRATPFKKNEIGGACSADGEERVVCIVFVGKHDGNRQLERTGVDGRIILGWIFRKWGVGVWTRLGWLRIETGGGQL
jgi:hypothetical protein